jgi:GNAT superfamily N-acetyltransferase
MIKVRIAALEELPRIEQFYRETDYGGGLRLSDTLVVAEEGGVLVGAVRLCDEFGEMVLRGMRVRRDRQRCGIGSRLLLELEHLLQDRVCYCVPHRYLFSFYGQIGFSKVAPEEAPSFLRERVEEYTRLGLDVVLMRRMPAALR